MTSRISKDIVRLSKQKIIPVIIVDVLGKLCSVRLSETGKLLRGIKYLGTSPSVGAAAYVDYRSGTPLVHTTDVNVEEAITAAGGRIIATVRSTPSRPPPEIRNPGSFHNDMAGIQGGLPATGVDPAEYYHLAESEYNALLGEPPDDDNQYVRMFEAWFPITNVGEILIPNVIHWWKLDETSGTRYDACSTKNLSPINTPGYAAGLLGNCVDLEHDSLQALSGAALDTETDGAFSISLWVKPESTGDNRILVSSQRTSGKTNGDWAIEQTNNQYLTFYTKNFSGVVIGKNTPASSLLTGSWSHIVITMDATRASLKCYINGSERTLSTTGHTWPSCTSYEFLVGDTTGGEAWDGLMDEIAIFARVLTGEEVTLLYNSGTPLSYEDAINLADNTYVYTPEAPVDGNLYGRKDREWISVTEFELPIATDEILGGIKVGDRLSIDGEGVLSADEQESGHVIQEDGVPFAQEPALNFTGDVEVSDDPGVATIVNISATNHFFIDQSGGTGDTYGVLAGDRNGVNVEFIVSQASYVTGTLSVYLNGQLLTQGSAEDWHEDDPATGKFHFATAPEASDEITVTYGYLGIGVGGSSSEFTPGIFLMSCHNSADEIAYLLASEDGKDWSLLHKDPISTPASGNQRDPAIVKIGGTFWIAHTNSTNTYFTVLSSPDLKQWSTICNVDMTDIANLFYVWAPQWFIDENGDVHVFVCCSTSGLTTNFQIYEVHPTNSEMTLWSSPVLITITGENNVIDPYVILKGGTYYLWYKEEDTDYIQYASSATLLGTYTNVETGDWASFGTPRESPSLIQLDTNTWRIYINEHSGFDSVAIYYSDSTDDWVTWSAPIAITSPWIIAAPTVIRLTDTNSLAKITGMFISGSRIRGTRVSRSTNQSIPTSTGTAISFTTVVHDELDSFDAGAPTRVTAKHSGWYNISGHIKCADTSGGKRVVDIRINGTDYIISNSVEATAGMPGPDIQDAISYFLTANDYIELIIWQNQGGSINITAAQLSVVET